MVGLLSAHAVGVEVQNATHIYERVGDGRCAAFINQLLCSRPPIDITDNIFLLLHTTL